MRLPDRQYHAGPLLADVPAKVRQDCQPETEKPQVIMTQGFCLAESQSVITLFIEVSPSVRCNI